MPLYALTEQEVALLQKLLDVHKGQLTNTPSRPPTEHSWSDREDHQSPEVYIAYPQDDPNEDDVGGTGTGTFWQRQPSLVIPGIVRATTEEDYDTISSEFCDLYRVIPAGGDNEDLRPVCGRSQKGECRQRVYNVSEVSIANQFVMAIRDKYGNYLAIPAGGLVKCMLAEDHPGRHTPGETAKEFKVWPGVWCAANAAWQFDCTNEDETWDAVDSWYGGASYTYDDITKYAQGWFQPMPYPDGKDGIVYCMVSGDCASDEDCTEWKLPCEQGV